MKTTLAILFLAFLSLAGCDAPLTEEEEQELAELEEGDVESAEQSIKAGSRPPATGGELSVMSCEEAKATGNFLIATGTAMLQSPDLATANLANAYIETGKAMIASACGPA